MVEIVKARGSIDRKAGRILTIETGSGVGKTYAARNADVLLERAAEAKAGTGTVSEPVQQILDAFKDGTLPLLVAGRNAAASCVCCRWFKRLHMR